ncbi:hypothetical protein BDF14DRAFT_1777006 [Spinellus fusiger]|nr:hypothetical protein BDF14DRAFT_1777006 [Spinellus fusiger]
MTSDTVWFIICLPIICVIYLTYCLLVPHIGFMISCVPIACIIYNFISLVATHTS